jgi:hypothetical protein
LGGEAISGDDISWRGFSGFNGTGEYAGCGLTATRGMEGSVRLMKKAMSVMFVLLFAMVLAGLGVSAAQAAYYGTPLQPYLFTGIDSDGEFINETVDPDTQNSAQYVIYDPANQNFIITAHPNYWPYDDEPASADQTTVVTAIQVLNRSGEYVNCIVGGTYVVPEDYLRATPTAGHPYLQFNVTFTKYDNVTGAVVSPSPYVYPTAYLDLTSVWP